MVLAVPLTAAIRGLFVYYFETHTSRQLVSEDGALFGSTPFNDENGRPRPTFDALDDDTFIARSRLLAGLSRLHDDAERSADAAEEAEAADAADVPDAEKDARDAQGVEDA